MSNTTHIPTLSEFFQVPLTSPKCFQSVDMFLTTLYQTERDAAHSGCTLPASRIFFRLITRTTNLRILRRLRQDRVHTPSRSSIETWGLIPFPAWPISQNLIAQFLGLALECRPLSSVPRSRRSHDSIHPFSLFPAARRLPLRCRVRAFGPRKRPGCDQSFPQRCFASPGPNGD